MQPLALGALGDSKRFRPSGGTEGNMGLRKLVEVPADSESDAWSFRF